MRARKDTLATSRKVREFAVSRRVQMPLVFVLKEKPRLVTIHVKDLGNLVIDPRVQREEIKTEVNDLIMVLKSGGTILQRLLLGEREDGTLSVLDGQQRLWAHIACEQDIQAEVIKVHSIEEERTVFNLTNTRTAVVPNHVAATWPGEAGDFLRRVVENNHSALFGNTDMGKNHGRPYSATLLMKAILWFLTGIATSMPIQKLMGRMDLILKDEASVKRALAFVDLLTLLNPPRMRLRSTLAVAISRVAHRKWSDGIVYPTSRSVTAIQKVNWENALPGSSIKFLPLAESILETKWK